MRGDNKGGSQGYPPMVVMMVPQKKKALDKSHLLVKLGEVLVASSPASTASTTFCGNRACMLNCVALSVSVQIQTLSESIKTSTA